jgi:hypothetical protein
MVTRKDVYVRRGNGARSKQRTSGMATPGLPAKLDARSGKRFSTTARQRQRRRRGSRTDLGQGCSSCETGARGPRFIKGRTAGGDTPYPVRIRAARISTSRVQVLRGAGERKNERPSNREREPRVFLLFCFLLFHTLFQTHFGKVL